MGVQCSEKSLGVRQEGSKLGSWHGVGVVLEDLGSAGEEGVKCLCTSAGHQISRVQVLPGRGGARLAPGPLSSLGPG